MDERVARLETRIEILDKKMDQLGNTLEVIVLDMARYRGAWGMLLMVGAAISTALTVWFKMRH